MTLPALSKEISECRACPRLVRWREKIAREKRAAYRNEIYWGRPVCGFGDPHASLWIVGLAPGAHGANRTGRMFTGDESGRWLYRALHKAGFAKIPTSESLQDGQGLLNAYISAVVRCAPPDNKPTPSERDRCLGFFIREMELLRNARVVVALGSFAWVGFLAAATGRGWNLSPKPKFGHGVEASVGPYRLLGSYHPSQQNTFTGRLTETMLDAVFRRARQLLI